MPSVREKSSSQGQQEQRFRDLRFHSWDGSYHTLTHKRKQVEITLPGSRVRACAETPHPAP